MRIRVTCRAPRDGGKGMTVYPDLGDVSIHAIDREGREVDIGHDVTRVVWEATPRAVPSMKVEFLAPELDVEGTLDVGKLAYEAYIEHVVDSEGMPAWCELRVEEQSKWGRVGCAVPFGREPEGGKKYVNISSAKLTAEPFILNPPEDIEPLDLSTQEKKLRYREHIHAMIGTVLGVEDFTHVPGRCEPVLAAVHALKDLLVGFEGDLPTRVRSLLEAAKRNQKNYVEAVGLLRAALNAEERLDVGPVDEIRSFLGRIP